jgi:hypothetical protein
LLWRAEEVRLKSSKVHGSLHAIRYRFTPRHRISIVFWALLVSWMSMPILPPADQDLGEHRVRAGGVSDQVG